MSPDELRKEREASRERQSRRDEAHAAEHPPRPRQKRDYRKVRTNYGKKTDRLSWDDDYLPGKDAMRIAQAAMGRNVF